MRKKKNHEREKAVAIKFSRQIQKNNQTKINCYDIIKFRSVIETSPQTFDADEYRTKRKRRKKKNNKITHTHTYIQNQNRLV